MTGFLSVLSSLPLHKLKQNGNENQVEVEEQTFKEKELDRKPEDVPPDILSSERYIKCVLCLVQLKLLFQSNKPYPYFYLACIYFCLKNHHTICMKYFHTCVIYKGISAFDHYLDILLRFLYVIFLLDYHFTLNV